MGRGAVFAELVTFTVLFVMVLCWPEFGQASTTRGFVTVFSGIIDCLIKWFIPSTFGGVVVTVGLEALKNN